MPSRPTNRTTFAKVMTMAAIGMGIGFGTCGLAVLGNSSSDGGFLPYVAATGAILFFICLAVLVVTFLVMIAMKFTESSK